MKSTALAAWCGILALAGVVVWRANSTAAARQRADSAVTVNARTAASVREIIQLKATHPTTGTTDRPTEDVLALAQRACKAAALNANIVRDVSPEGERAASNGLVQQSARIGLDGLTPPELAAILKQLSQLQRVWSVQRVELSSPDKANGRYRVQIIVTAFYTGATRSKDRAP